MKNDCGFSAHVVHLYRGGAYRRSLPARLSAVAAAAFVESYNRHGRKDGNWALARPAGALVPPPRWLPDSAAASFVPPQA